MIMVMVMVTVMVMVMVMVTVMVVVVMVTVRIKAIIMDTWPPALSNHEKWVTPQATMESLIMVMADSLVVEENTLASRFWSST